MGLRDVARKINLLSKWSYGSLTGMVFVRRAKALTHEAKTDFYQRTRAHKIRVMHVIWPKPDQLGWADIPLFSQRSFFLPSKTLPFCTRSTFDSLESHTS
jgi:hypothetical protein